MIRKTVVTENQRSWKTNQGSQNGCPDMVSDIFLFAAHYL